MKYLIITDIHDKYRAIETIVQNIPRKTIKICLGDIIGGPVSEYSTIENSNLCIELLQKYDFKITKGNHDLFHTNKIPNGCLFETFLTNNLCWPYKDERNVDLTTENYNSLQNSPEFIIHNGILFSHFLYPDFTGYLSLKKETLDFLFKTHLFFMETNNCNLSFIGHLHVEAPTLIIKGKKSKIILNNNRYFLNKKDKYIIICSPVFNGIDKYNALLYDENLNCLDFISYSMNTFNT